MIRQCKKCHEWKDDDAFPSGHNRCKECARLYMAEWANRNRDKINENQRTYHATIAGRASVLLNAAIKRARARSEPFGLTINDVIKGVSVGYCARTLFPFDLSVGERRGNYRINPFAPSIDKIEPNGIYEPGNVQYVIAWYNLAKGAMTEQELITFCQRVAALYS